MGKKISLCPKQSETINQTGKAGKLNKINTVSFDQIHTNNYSPELKCKSKPKNIKTSHDQQKIDDIQGEKDLTKTFRDNSTTDNSNQNRKNVQQEMYSTSIISRGSSTKNRINSSRKVEIDTHDFAKRNWASTLINSDIADKSSRKDSHRNNKSVRFKNNHINGDMSLRNNLNSNYKKSAYYRLNNGLSVLSANDRRNVDDNAPRLDIGELKNLRSRLNESMRTEQLRQLSETGKIDKLYQVQHKYKNATILEDPIRADEQYSNIRSTREQRSKNKKYFNNSKQKIKDLAISIQNNLGELSNMNSHNRSEQLSKMRNIQKMEL